MSLKSSLLILNPCAMYGLSSAINFSLTSSGSLGVPTLTLTLHEPEPGNGCHGAPAKEWKRLRELKTWDDASVVNDWDVKREARRLNEETHVGRICAIVVERHHELPESDPARKYKGRVVFQGNQVRDTSCDYAIFHELGEQPGYHGRRQGHWVHVPSRRVRC